MVMGGRVVEVVRRWRREVVGGVGRALEEGEGEVEGRGGVGVRRGMRTERGREEVEGKAEEKVAVENDAVKIEAEAKDRTIISWPGNQLQLIS